jgi:hypothetical protein
MDHIPEGIGKIVHFCGEKGKHDHTVKALMETAEQSNFQFLLLVLYFDNSFNYDIE